MIYARRLKTPWLSLSEDNVNTILLNYVSFDVSLLHSITAATGTKMDLERSCESVCHENLLEKKRKREGRERKEEEREGRERGRGGERRRGRERERGEREKGRERERQVDRQRLIGE